MLDVLITTAITTLAASHVVAVLALLIPVAITVAAIAGWRESVPGTGLLAVHGALLCLWLGLPFPLSPDEFAQLGRMISLLGWFWLVWGWGKLVLREWPAPIWAHWGVGTLLLLLALVSLAVVTHNL